ncbi:unnamed protein product [Lactuca virosa]|uniref:Uncharacterized protein n=1 Tax=Lactuca virosa TaxID=75947 RepID=A0AAU9M1Z5_9ASTR|nr:unnamed protein product [Lactuca virosa]
MILSAESSIQFFSDQPTTTPSIVRRFVHLLRIALPFKNVLSVAPTPIQGSIAAVSSVAAPTPIQASVTGSKFIILRLGSFQD